MSDLFELTPVQREQLGKSTRTQDWHRRALERRAKMHARHGHGPEGQTCTGCVHLIRHYTGGTRSFLKCDLQAVSRSEASDWRAKWPACGAYRAKA